MQINDAKLIHGDCMDAMKELDDCSVHSCVTDPPYGLSFMGKKWDYDIPPASLWLEVLRVLKPGGHLLAFSGTRTQHRMVCAIEDAGFEIRDMISWIYGSGFPKSHNLDGEWQGWGTALKPALEPVTVARKPFKGTVAANVIEFGTGALNIDGCRIHIMSDDQNMRKPSAPYQNGIPMPTGTSKGRPVENLDKQGRWPANLIHDGSDEVVLAFPQTHGAGTYRRGETSWGGFTSENEQRPAIDDGGSCSRFFYTAKASKGDRDSGVAGVADVAGVGALRDNGRESKPRKNMHPTVKPTDLMRYLCRLVTPPRGVVLDPFMGSGSTGMAAELEGFKFIGIEREQEYFDIAAQRVRKAGEQPDMFLHFEERAFS